MVKSYGVGGGGGPCDFSVSPSPNFTFCFGTSLGLGLELSLGGLGSGLGLDNKMTRVWDMKLFAVTVCLGHPRRLTTSPMNKARLHSHNANMRRSYEKNEGPGPVKLLTRNSLKMYI